MRLDLKIDRDLAFEQALFEIPYHFECFFCYFLISFTNRYIVENRRYIK